MKATETPGGRLEAREWCLTLRRAPLAVEESPCRLRILRPVFDDLPPAIHAAASRVGASVSRWAGRPAVEGDLRAIQALAGASRDSTPGFCEALNQVLARSSRRRFELHLHRGRRLALGDPPALFGVINATPDSFSDGGLHLDPGQAHEAAMAMVEAGVDAIDVGGESSRPGSRPVSLREEWSRVQPVLRRIRKTTEIPISVDTTKAELARMALEEGADIINDVSALRDDPKMISVARESGAPIIILHRLGTSRDMQDNPGYDDVVGEVYSFLSDRLRALESEGIDSEKVIVDPGIGFGKLLEHNLALIRDTGELCSLGRPVLVGASRKSFLGKLLGLQVQDREAGTLAAHAVAIAGGASALRVHQVPGHRDLIRVLWALSRPAATRAAAGGG